jgi:DNA-binding beta-propeller fold protein YncE
MARTATLAALVFALSSATAHAATPTAHVYATSWDAAGVHQYAADETGILSPLTPPAAPAGTTSTGAVASPDARSLYVVNQGSNDVSQYDVAVDGTLSPKTPATVPTQASPFGIDIAPDGEHVYVANQGAGSVSVFDVGSDGALTPSSTAAAGPGALQVALSPDGTSAYVTNLSGGTVSQFDVNGDGSLTPKAAPTVPAAPSPTGIAVSTDGDSVYVANRSGATISQFDVGADGGLAPKVPDAKIATGVQPIAVAATDDGVYASNFGADTISQYDADAGGALRPKATPTVPGGRNPWSLMPSPDGASLYVAAYSDAAVRQFDIGPDGALAPKATPSVDAGVHPIGVATVIARDGQGPTIDLRTPADGAEYAIGAHVVADYACADEGGSGVESCEGDVPSGEPLDTAKPGAHSFTVTARDREGNTASVTHRFTVAGYPFGGFLGPIFDGATVKAGSTIPIVFSLGGDRGLDVLAPGSPASGRVDCAAPGEPASTQPAASDRGLRFSSRTGHYVFKWRTDRAWAGTCRSFVLTLSDGSVHRLLIRFRPSCYRLWRL